MRHRAERRPSEEGARGHPPGEPHRCLVVSAHPLADSLSQHLADAIVTEVDKYGWVAERLDLYAAQFSPQLTAEERKSYYLPDFDGTAVRLEIEQLQRAEILILVFPTWWFGFPAILKGWFDRVWAPGVAFAHADDLKSIKPLLSHLRWVLAVTTLGAPHWVDRLVLRRPVRRVLKTALVGACAPQAGFSMKTLYRAEAVDTVRAIDFEKTVRAEIRAIARRLE